uniref:Transmembrane protein 167B n=1 Tax=Cricetulus griseus TaxID=10029 RepID=A0A8C2LTZ6_CRIGR
MLLPASLFSSPPAVLVGWDSGVWFAFCLHLCLLQESTSSQNLATLREERSLGCVLQSCCDWDPTACCCCNCLHCNGLLRPVYQMNSKVSHSSTMKNLSGAWTQCRRVHLKSSVSLR